jgi:hypothetical protein
MKNKFQRIEIRFSLEFLVVNFATGCKGSARHDQYLRSRQVSQLFPQPE